MSAVAAESKLIRPHGGRLVDRTGDRPEGGREDNDWEMTLMGTTTKANAGLEDHELASVSGGLASQVVTEASIRSFVACCACQKGWRKE